MKTTPVIAISLLLGFTSGCSDGHSPTEPSTPSGNALVLSLIEDNTTDSAEPIDVNGLELEFSEDEGAFSDLLQD